MGFLDSLKDSLKYPRFSEKYEMGFPDISSGDKPVIIQFRENEVEFKILTGFTSVKKIIKPNDIIEVGLNQETYRSGGKAAAGAIGLLAGAAIGGKRRKENQLTLIVNDNGNECDIFLKPSKDIPKLYSELKRLLSKQTTKPILKESEISNIETKSNLVSDLEKLHSLLEKGILTQQEFDEQKRKLLE